MKFIISEHQYKMINEQLGYSSGGYPEVMKTSQKEFEKQYPTLTNFLRDLSLWFVPYIGPYLVAAKGTYEGIESIKKGDNFMGIVQLITSPLALGKYLRFAKLYGMEQNEFMKMLEMIYKSGLPVLKNEGVEQFFRWGQQNFGTTKFNAFVENIKDTTQLQSFLNSLNDEERKKVEIKKT
jgi:hypothetical protein